MKLLWRMVILSFFFWQILAKTCSIMVSRGFCMGMARRGDFSKICLFFPQGICTFFVFRWEKNAVFASFFWCPFFCFTRVSFKKQQKKLNPHSKVNERKYPGHSYKQDSHISFSGGVKGAWPPPNLPGHHVVHKLDFELLFQSLDCEGWSYDWFWGIGHVQQLYISWSSAT